MRVAYGYELQDDDEYVAIIEHATEGLTETFGIGFLVDLFPICMLLFSSSIKFSEKIHVHSATHSEIYPRMDPWDTFQAIG